MSLIPPQALKVRQADVTRETVQKSVCVLSRVVSNEVKYEGDDHVNADRRDSR